MREAAGRRFAGLAPLLACACLIAAWQAAAHWAARGGVPDAVATFRELPLILGDPAALRDIGASLARMGGGFAIALLLAVPFGLLMGRNRLAAAAANPLLMIAYPVPKAALMPLIMLWLGIGDAAKLLVIVLGTSLPILYHSYQGAAAVEEKMLWSAHAMGMSAPSRLWRIVLPAALPEILVGCRTGIVLALITMFTSEMIARQSGAGNILFSALDMAQYETVFAMILVVSALGIVLDMGFVALRAALTGWAEDGGAASR